MEDIVIPYRPKDKRGTELIFALGRRLAGGSVQGVEMKSFQWPLDDGSARYHLFGESVGADCLGGTASNRSSRNSTTPGETTSKGRSGAAIYRRGGLTVEASNSHDDYWVRNLVSLRAESRQGLAVLRPAAFTVVTFS